jgi:hypothetical protein
MYSTAALLLVASVAAQTATVTRTVAATTVFTTPGPSITAVSDCHPHSTVKYIYDYKRWLEILALTPLAGAWLAKKSTRYLGLPQ